MYIRELHGSERTIINYYNKIISSMFVSHIKPIIWSVILICKKFIFNSIIS